MGGHEKEVGSAVGMVEGQGSLGRGEATGWGGVFLLGRGWLVGNKKRKSPGLGSRCWEGWESLGRGKCRREGWHRSAGGWRLGGHGKEVGSAVGMVEGQEVWGAGRPCRRGGVFRQEGAAVGWE